jgi:hypothetical protein
MAKQTFTTGQVLTAAQMISLQQTAMLGGAASAKTASYTLVAADAGTAISMSSASATTITVNTALFAAGDTVQITNLGVGVCTITPGTATVNTSASLALAQYESGTLDFTSTSAAIFIKGAAGAAASSGLVLVKRSSFSNVANTSTTFDNVFTSTYKAYQVVIEELYATTAGDDGILELLYSGSVWGEYYGASGGAQSNSATFVNIQNSGSAQFTFVTSIGVSSSPTTANFLFAQVGGSAKAANMTGTAHEAATAIARFCGFNVAAEAYTGFRLRSSSTNVTGTVAVYGLATA